MKNENETGFFGFILDAQKNDSLLDKFKKLKDFKDLERFFLEENPGYGLTNAELRALWDARYKLDALYQLREVVGSYWFSAEYLGTPRPEGGGIIKEAWFNYFSDTEDPLQNEDIKILRCVQIWDTAFEESESSSRSACVTIIETRTGYYIIDVWAERVEFPELVFVMKDRECPRVLHLGCPSRFLHFGKSFHSFLLL